MTKKHKFNLYVTEMQRIADNGHVIRLRFDHKRSDRILGRCDNCGGRMTASIGDHPEVASEMLAMECC